MSGDDVIPGNGPRPIERMLQTARHIVAEAAVDPGAPFEDEFVNILATIKNIAPAEWERLRLEFSESTGVRVHMLERHLDAILRGEARPPRLEVIEGGADGRLTIDPLYPKEIAATFIEKRQTYGGKGLLWEWQEKLLIRGENWFIGRRKGRLAYHQLTMSDAKAMAWDFLARCVVDTRQGKVPYPVDPAGVERFLEAVKAEVHLPAEQDPPFWIIKRPNEPVETVDYDDAHPPARQFLPVANGLLNLPQRELEEQDPTYFALHGSPVAYDPDAHPPARFVRFLEELWPDDPESIETLQEFCGYLLSSETQYQKILLMIGPIRSGKGVIARLLKAVIGEDSVVAPTLASLGERFGLEPMIGKPVAIISDARLSSRTDSVVVTERLLSISGEDHMTVDRKYASAWHGRLPSRFVIMSNELPTLTDAAGALVSRLIVVKLTQSFYGREDLSLEPMLTAGLPGILNWMLDGYDRLRARGRFKQPQSGEAAVAELHVLASAIKAFVRDRCILEAEAEADVAILYSEYVAWCRETNVPERSQPYFSRDLTTAFPKINVVRPAGGADKRPRKYKGIRLR